MDQIHDTHNIRLTEFAHKRALRYLKDEPNFSGLPLRIFVEGKGCSGFTYGVCFADPETNDAIADQDGLTIAIDQGSLKFIHGSTVDWVDDDRGCGFLVENPMGSKFKGKFYKRENWEERLENAQQI